MKNMTGRVRLTLFALALCLIGAVVGKAGDTAYYPWCVGGYGDVYASAYVSFGASTSVYAGAIAGYYEDTDFNACIDWAQSGAMSVNGRWAAGNSYWTEQG